MPSTRYEISSPQVIHETIDGEVVIINLESGNYYSLRGTGARAWAGIDQGAEPSAIAGDLESSFAGAGSAGAEVETFLAALEAEGLIRASDQPDVPLALPEPAGAAAYAPPVLETFTDMQDLILLDPVHEVDEAHGWPQPKPLA